MKRVILGTIAALVICDIALAQFAGVVRGQKEEPLPEGFKPASTNTFISQYPAVNAQTRQAMFRVVAPYAQQVLLDLSSKKYAMKKDEKGIWTCISDPQVVGFHYYAVLIDSVAVMDRGSKAYFGSNWESAGIEIPEGPEGNYYRFDKNIPHGQIRSFFYWSDVNGLERHVNVYVPAGYEKTTETKYPVLYLVHGWGENENGWSVQGHMANIMDGLIESGKAVPMIVVMPSGDIQTNSDVREASGDITKIYINDLIPFIDKTFRPTQTEITGPWPACQEAASKPATPYSPIWINLPGWVPSAVSLDSAVTRQLKQRIMAHLRMPMHLTAR